MPKKLSKEEWVEVFRKVHGDRFNYSETQIVNATTKAVIVCPDHGEFTQSPDVHKRSKNPCPQCYKKIMDERLRALAKCRAPKPRLSVEEFIQRLGLDETRLVVDVAEYEGLTLGAVSIKCPKHGLVRYSPPEFALVTKYKCAGCAIEGRAANVRKGFDDFVSRATEAHGGAYTYGEPPENFSRASTIDIECPTHGIFQCMAKTHLAGQGCSVCTMHKAKLAGKFLGGYTLSHLETNKELAGRWSTLYYLKVGSLYKIGVTTLPLAKRVTQIKYTSKTPVEVVDTCEGTLYDVYTVEQSILDKFSDKRVIRHWSTELFSENVLVGTSLLAHMNKETQ